MMSKDISEQERKDREAAEERFPYTQVPIGEHHLVHRARIETNRAIFLAGIAHARSTPPSQGAEEAAEYGWNNVSIFHTNGREYVLREEAESNFNAFLEGQDEACAEKVARERARAQKLLDALKEAERRLLQGTENGVFWRELAIGKIGNAIKEYSEGE